MTPYPPLYKSFKKAFPFRICAPSFIYPDTYLPNVRMLGTHVDEIELLYFESAWPESLPESDEIRQLVKLGREMDITYNVHLPTDVPVSAPDAETGLPAFETLKSFVRRTLPLAPSAYILHLPLEEASAGRKMDLRLEGMAAGIRKLLTAGCPPKVLAVENLVDSLEPVMPLIESLGLSICMDVGHLLISGISPIRFWEAHADRISVIHMHGVCDGRDHQPLTALSEEQKKMFKHILNNFKGVLSLEVFSYDHLNASLKVLDQMTD